MRSPITYSGASCSSAARRQRGFQAGIDCGDNLLHQQSMLGDREGMIAQRLAVPAGNAREAVRDVLDLDVGGRGVKQVEAAAGQHALPGARGLQDRGAPSVMRASGV